MHPVEGFYGGTRPRPSCHMDDDGGDAHLFETGEGDGLNLDEDEGTSFPPTVTIIPESNGAGVVELTTAGENASQTLSHGSVRGDRKSECSRAASPKHKLSTVFYCVGFFSPPACPVLPPDDPDDFPQRRNNIHRGRGRRRGQCRRRQRRGGRW